MSITRLVASFFVLFALFSFLYTFAPDRKLKRREVISGALFTVGWIVVSYSFAYYVDKFANYANTYGGLGGIIILMLWFYLTGWVILLAVKLMVYSTIIEPVTIIPAMNTSSCSIIKRNRGYFMSNNKKNHNNKSNNKQKSSSHPKHKTSSSANGHNSYH